MNFLDTIFRIFMFLFPYVVCFAAYLWVGKKAWRAPKGIARIIALVFVIGGTGYTLYKLVRSIGGMMTNDNFEFVILIVMVFILFFASIALAMAEPEKETT
jgi:high-affinity K+ transport system ATPase subunit B